MVKKINSTPFTTFSPLKGDDLTGRDLIRSRLFEIGVLAWAILRVLVLSYLSIALLIPGGYSPDQLRVDEDAVHFVKEFVERNKPVFAICHAPQLLITAQVLKGRKITGWKSIIQDIKNAGAEFIDLEVVEDGNLISSRDPRDLPAFINAALTRLKELKKL